tara:strand:- start:4963 stop:5598 length:636 start_codon:yes stop_codon:yes gene_type:complete
MKKTGLLLLFLGFMLSVCSQGEWKLRKEKYGVKAYTRSHPDYSISEYKVEAKVNSTIADIISIMTEESSYLKMFKDLEELKFYKQRDDYFELYLVNRAPFPARDRDGYFVSQFSYDSKQQIARIDITCPNSQHHRKKYIEITRCQGYWQFHQKNEHEVEVIQQFVADPGGFVPGFILNIFLVNNPINTIRDLKILLKEGLFKKKEFEFLKN